MKHYETNQNQSKRKKKSVNGFFYRDNTTQTIPVRRITTAQPNKI